MVALLNPASVKSLSIIYNRFYELKIGCVNYACFLTMTLTILAHALMG